MYVIEQKRGIPISLACVYILVGYRLDLEIEGINLPGHFLAKCMSSGRPHVVDCFNGGHFLSQKDLASVQTPPPISMHDVLSLECKSSTIIGRVLRNLKSAYQQVKQDADLTLMNDLLTSTPDT